MASFIDFAFREEYELVRILGDKLSEIDSMINWEWKYSSSPDGMWQFEGYKSNLEKTHQNKHTQNAEPRTVCGDMLSGVLRHKSSPGDKLVITDPVS